MWQHSCESTTEKAWPERLFQKSWLKQTKFNQIIKFLGPVGGRHILEVGSDNGVFSYLFRQLGGSWKSADVDERSVRAMKELVGTDVYQLSDGRPLPFSDGEFDCVIVVDILEHLNDDFGFIQETYRVLKPEGLLILNAPVPKEDSLLMRFRRRIGLTDADHGHLRSGYSYGDLKNLLGQYFTLDTYETHTGFFAKLMDTMMVWAVSLLKGSKVARTSPRGVVVTGDAMASHKSLFHAYALVYPLVRIISGLDKLLPVQDGFMFIAAGYSRKPAPGKNDTGAAVAESPALCHARRG